MERNMKPAIIADEVPNAESILAQMGRRTTLKAETVILGDCSFTRLHPRKPSLVLLDELDKSECPPLYPVHLNHVAPKA